MKKALIVFILITAVLIIGYYVGRSYIIPTIIAESIKSENPPPAFLPDKIEKTVAVLKNNVDQEVEHLPELMNELNLNFDDLIYSYSKLGIHFQNPFFFLFSGSCRSGHADKNITKRFRSIGGCENQALWGINILINE